MRFRFLLFTFLALAFSPPGLLAQSSPGAKIFTLKAANQNACIGTAGLPTVGITLSGTASLTLQPQVSTNGSTPSNSSVTSTVAASTAQATIVVSGTITAANNGYVAPVGSSDTFCLNVSSYSSGSLTVQLNPSPALNASLLGGSSSGLTFDKIGSGSNDSAAMVVAAGSTLLPSTGQITANSEFLANAAVATPPSPLSTGDCESGTNPFSFTLDNAGTPTYHQAAGINTNVGFTSYTPKGMIEHCRPVIFNATGGAVPTALGSNSSPMTANGSLLIFGSPAFSTIASQIQVSSLTGDSSTYSGEWEGMYAETDVFGSPTLSGNSPAGQQNSSLRGVWADQSSTVGNAAQGFGVSAAWFRDATTPNNGGGAFYAFSDNLHTGTFNSSVYDYYAGGGDGQSGSAGVFNAFFAQGPASAWGGGEYAFRASGFTASNQYFLFDEDSGSQALMNGTMALAKQTNLDGTYPISGSVALTGSLTTTQIANPSQEVAVVNSGTPGGTAYSYSYTCLDASGATTAGTSAASTASGNATLNTTNFNTLEAKQIAGCTSYNFYRTASSGTPSSTGLIGNVVTNLVTDTFANVVLLQDKGLAGDSSTAPVTNTTGSINIAGIYEAGGTPGVSGGSFSAITAITSVAGIVTQLSGTSDNRLKGGEDYTGGLQAVLKIHPKRYRWNQKGHAQTGLPTNQNYVGFFAQDVQAAIPEAITATEKPKPGAETTDGSNYLDFDDRPVVAALVSAVKEQQAEIKQLEAEVRTLKAARP